MTGGRHPDTDNHQRANVGAESAQNREPTRRRDYCDAPELGLFISSFDRILKRNADDNESSINPKNNQLRNLEHSPKHSSLRTERSRN